MEEKMIKLMRPKNTKYAVDYPLPNGTRLHYEWRPATVHQENVVEVPQQVFEYLKYNTSVFQLGKLVVVEEEVKEEMEYMMEDAKKVLTTKQVKAILESPLKKFKEEVAKYKDDKDTVAYLVSVAKEIKLDSSAKQKVLADAMKLPVDILFATED